MQRLCILRRFLGDDHNKTWNDQFARASRTDFDIERDREIKISRVGIEHTLRYKWRMWTKCKTRKETISYAFSQVISKQTFQLEWSFHLLVLLKCITTLLCWAEVGGEITCSSSSTSVPMEERPSMTLHDAAINHNKQCSLACCILCPKKLRWLRSETNVFTTYFSPLFFEAEVDFLTEWDQYLDY